MLQVVVV